MATNEALAATERLLAQRRLKVARERFSNFLFGVFGHDYHDLYMTKRPVRQGLSEVMYTVDAYPTVQLDWPHTIALRRLKPITDTTPRHLPLRIELVDLRATGDLFSAEGERLGGWKEGAGHGLFTPLGELHSEQDLQDLVQLTNLVLGAAGVETFEL